jgi:DNA-binding LacI/PurR family transcriptional regulator
LTPPRKGYTIDFNVQIAALAGWRNNVSATMRDVAEQAGVSIQTVSNVLNERPIVAEETRQRVLQTVQQLGYQPNAIARGLRANRTNTIALVLMTSQRRYLVRKPYLNDLISGIADAARDSNFGLLFQSVAPEASAAPIAELFRSRRVDGVILNSTESGEMYVTDLLSSRVPFVLIDRPIVGPEAACVRGDYYGGACLAVRHLIAQDHTRIGYLSGDTRAYSGAQRLQGYRDVMAEAGLAEAIIYTDWSQEDAARALPELLDQYPDLTAVFVASDLMAVGVYEAAEARGLRIPDDLAVVGFNDLYFTTLLRPTLTTVHLPAYELGVQATEMMLARLTTGRFPTTDLVLPTALMVRASA